MVDAMDLLKAEAPKTSEALMKLLEMASREGGLDEKTKQLVILGMAVATRNEYSAVRHAARAKKAGAKRSDLIAVMLTGISVVGLSSVLPMFVQVLKSYDKSQ